MNKLKEALQKIVNQPKEVVENGYYGNFEDIIHIAQQALSTEVTEPRMFCEEELAKLFHDTYERLAPEFGYATREDTKVFDQNSANGKLMVAVCEVILQSLSPKEGKEKIA